METEIELIKELEKVKQWKNGIERESKLESEIAQARELEEKLYRARKKK